MPQDVQGAGGILNSGSHARVPGVAAMSARPHSLFTSRTVGQQPTRHGGNGDGVTLLIKEPASCDSEGQQAGAVRTLVAMPAYNEEAYIAKTIVGAQQYADKVLVVDDGSKDDTVRIAGALGALVVQHETNKGYGGALQTIFCTAREMGAEELVILDSDGQHNPGDIPRLLAELRKGNDVVIGSRFIDDSNAEIPAYRKVGMKILDTATTIAGTNLAITDSQSGFRAYGRKAIEAIRISDEGMSAGSEILILISDHRLNVAEVPIQVRYDIAGTSSENPVSHGVEVLMNIVRLISLRRPLVFFGVPGLVITLFGLGAELHTFSEYYRTSEFHYIIFTGGFSMLILGLLLVAVGMILYSLVQIVLQGQGERGGWSPLPVQQLPFCPQRGPG
ncbi:Undecaprenyl-phosphate 4-deoxy-4-formamido-L-arabinose transferase [anaerobic digester metagenome]